MKEKRETHERTEATQAHPNCRLRQTDSSKLVCAGGQGIHIPDYINPIIQLFVLFFQKTMFVSFVKLADFLHYLEKCSKTKYFFVILYLIAVRKQELCRIRTKTDPTKAPGKRTKLKAGGKPSTRFSPGKLVEHVTSNDNTKCFMQKMYFFKKKHFFRKNNEH